MLNVSLKDLFPSMHNQFVVGTAVSYFQITCEFDPKLEVWSG